MKRTVTFDGKEYDLNAQPIPELLRYHMYRLAQEEFERRVEKANKTDEELIAEKEAAWKTLREGEWARKEQEHVTTGQTIIAYCLFGFSGMLVGVIGTLILIGF